MEDADLATPEAGGKLQQEQLEATILFGLDEQPLNLLWSQNLHFSCLGGGEAAEVGGIFGDDLLRDCLVQRRVEGSVDSTDSLVGKSFTVLFLPEQAAILFESSIELLDINGGEFAQRDGTQVWNDVLIDPTFVGHLGVGTQIWLFMSLVPEVQPLGDRHILLRCLWFGFFFLRQQCFQLFLAFRFGFCQHIFCFGQTFVIVADDHSAFPASVASQAEASAAMLSLLCQGFISTPR